MARIKFENVRIDFPILSARGSSLKSQILNFASGGRLDSDSQGVIHVSALEDISFSMSDGDRVALLGHNGAGKSTLLRALAGVYEPKAGVVDIEGELASLIDISLGINSEATGRENIFTRAALLGLTKNEIQKKIEEIVRFSDLGNFVDLPVRTYSSGMQLRLAFAVSTIIRPEILVMDEWLSVGDEDFKQKAEERLDDLVGTTKIMVIATHSKDLVEQVCNRAIWLEKGKIRMDGPATKVANHYFSSDHS